MDELAKIGIITLIHKCGEGQIIVDVAKAIEAHKNCNHATQEELFLNFMKQAMEEFESCPCIENKSKKKVNDELKKLFN